MPKKIGIRTKFGGGAKPMEAKQRIDEKIDRVFGKKRGKKSHEEASPSVLPFESSLAYVFRSAGGKETAIAAARLIEDDERFKKLLYAYDTSTERDKSAIRLEDLCAAADITPDAFLGIVISALWKRNVDIGKLLAAMAHPRVVEATIDGAMRPQGVMDRKMMHDHIGFLPIPKGQVINVDNSSKTLVAGSKVEQISGPGLPTFEEDGLIHSPVIRGRLNTPDLKQLPEGTKGQVVKVPEEIVVEPEVESV